MIAVSESTASRLAWLTLAGIVLLVLGGLAFSLATGAEASEGMLFTLVMLSFPAVGAVIANRQPRNSIGWIMLGVGVVSGIVAVLETYGRYALVVTPGSLPGPEIALALSAPTWVAFVGLPGTFLILLFPDGRLPSARWRWWAWLCAVSLVLSFVGVLIGPGSLAEVGYPGIQNPLGIGALEPFVAVVHAPIPMIPVCIVGCAVAVVGRFRRSRGQERLQLKWLTLGAGATAILYLLAMVPTLALDAPWDGSGPRWLALLQNLAVYSFGLMPFAVGIAVLRHRLYDIDVIVNRALVYGVLSATLGLCYVAGVVLLQLLFEPLTRGSELAVAGSTLAVAALFGPLRARVQASVDRRFYRRRYDAARTLERFSARLREQVDLDALAGELEAVARETMAPEHVSLWLRARRADEAAR